jgi:predicted enzyme related to lactoylglutathione lyase
MQMANQFFWYDVMTTDTDAAAGFYRDVVGWATQDAGQVNQDIPSLPSAGSPSPA